MTLKRFSVVAATVGAVLVAVVLTVVSGVLEHWTSVAIDKISQLVASVAALVCYLRAARRAEGTERRWRLWMVAAMTSVTVGLSVWIWGQVFLGVPLPSSTLAQLGFMLVPMLGLCAVLSLAHSVSPTDLLPNHRSKVVVVLDGLVVVGSLFVLTWVSALESMVRAWATSGPGFATVVAHPAVYLVLVVTLVVLSWTHRSVRQLPMLFLALAALSQSASGWVFAYLVSQGATSIPPLADVGFMMCPVLLFLSSIAPVSGERHRSASGRLRTGEMLHLLVPYVPLLVIGLFIAVGTATGARFDAVEIYAGLGVVLLVIVRQLLTMIDNVRLLEQLHDSREQLRHQAFHDSLTGVANRALLRDRLAAALARRDRTGRPLVLLFIDVDGFKQVNDDFGHAAGDAVLRNVASRLLHCVRAEDTVARLGGDEFGVLIDGHSSPPAEIGWRLLGVLQRPHQIQGREHVVRASIGVHRHLAYDPAVTADDMLGCADAAMYRAKRQGKGTVVVHDPISEMA
jgi:diguanylate cyclase (GGDEF)-like protein